jgi:glutamate decarboxylase
MPIAQPPSEARNQRAEVAVNPVFAREPVRVPRFAVPDDGLDPDTAYQVVHDELMLDGNARLNPATFVTTWAEPHAARLMAESFDKNMIDKDEYPRTADLEQRCVRMPADLWHAPDPATAVGCSTTGSSEACMLAGLALKRRWQHARRAAGKPVDRPTWSWASTCRSAGTSSPTSSTSSRA